MKMAKVIPWLFALCMASVLLLTAALADTEGYTAVTSAVDDIYPYGATLFGEATAPNGVSCCVGFNYGKTSDLTGKDTKGVFSGFNGTGSATNENVIVEDLEPDTDYYFQFTITEASNFSVLARGDIIEFHTPALTSSGTVSPETKSLDVNFAADEAKYFKYTPDKPTLVNAVITVPGTNGVNGIRSFSKNNLAYFCSTSNTNNSYSFTSSSGNCIFSGDNYLEIKSNDAGNYRISISYAPMPELKVGNNSGITSSSVLFQAPADGKYTFTAAGCSDINLKSGDGESIGWSSGSASTALGAGEYAVLSLYGQAPEGGYTVDVSEVDDVKGMMLCVDNSPNKNNLQSTYISTYNGFSQNVSFYYGTPNNFVALMPSSVKLNASDGLDVYLTDYDAKNGTFSIEPLACGEYSLAVSGTDASGTAYSGTISVHAVPNKNGFSTTPSVTDSSYIPSKKYCFSSDAATIYYYDQYNCSQAYMAGCKAQISTDGSTWADYANTSVMDSGDGKYVLKVDITASSSMCYGKIRIVNADGNTLYGNLTFRALKYCPSIRIYTDEDCTVPFTGTLAITDTPTQLYFKSSDSNYPLLNISEPQSTARWARVSWGNLDTENNVLPMSFSACTEYAGTRDIKLSANITGHDWQDFTIPASSNSSMYFKAVNTGEVITRANISEKYVGGLTYDIQAMSGTSKFENFTISYAGDQSIAKVTKDGSLLKIAYVSPGNTSVTLTGNGITRTVLIACYKNVVESQWEKDARYAVQSANGSPVTLKLDQNIELASRFELYNADVTLDLNGYTLSFLGSDSMFQVDFGSKLTVKDSSAAQTGLIDAGKFGTAISVSSSALFSGYAGDFTPGILTVQSGTITGHCTISIQGGGKMLVEGGVLTNSGTACCVTNYGTIIMTGGKIVCNNGTAVFNICLREEKLNENTSGYFEMTSAAKLSADKASLMSETDSGPVVSGGNTAITSKGGIVKVSTGTVKADVNNGTAIQSSGPVTISGGTVTGGTGVELTSTPYTDQNNQSRTDNGTLTATGGTIAANTAVAGADETKTSTVGETVTQTQSEKVACTMSLTVSGGLATLTVDSNYTSSTVKVICAAYNSAGKQISVTLASSGVEAGSKTFAFTVDPSATIVKAFVLNPNTCSPCGAQTMWSTAA